MDQRGFSIVEVIVASGLLIAAIASVAQLVVMSARATAVAGARSMAAAIAIDKMEQLRGLAWTVDAAGNPVNDPALAESPVDALDRDVAGFSDRVGAFARRWWIRPLPIAPADGLLLQVRVIAWDGHDVRLATVRARRGN